LIEGCGTSETGGGLAMPSEEKPLNPKSVGRPMVGFEVRVVDDAGRDVPDNEPGEIVMRGDCVAVGYYKQPEIQADTYRNGWFHTGDIGRRDDAGYYYLMDRKKDLIITGGMNVYPAEVEQFVYEFDEVYECAVVGLPHNHWGEAVTAFVVLREDVEVTGEQIRERLHDKLSDYQVPKDVVIVEALPRTMFGKLHKIQLRNDFGGHYTNGRAIE
jgi:fatty-acyl-CoA synthase